MDGTVGGTTETRAGAPDEVSPVREWGWVLRVLALVVVFAVVAIARSRQVDVPFRDPHGKLFTNKLLSTAQTLLVAVAIDIVVRWFHGRRRGRSLWQTARSRWTPYRIGDDPGRGTRRLPGGLPLLPQPQELGRPPRPQDDMLLRWDRWLFFGHSPAVLLHDLLGAGPRRARC